jgi:hypothetical protein
MSCPNCIVALSGPDLGAPYAVRRSVPFGDEPTASPSISSLAIFAVSGVAAYLLLAVAMPATGKHLSRSGR